MSMTTTAAILDDNHCNPFLAWLISQSRPCRRCNLGNLEGMGLLLSLPLLPLSIVDSSRY